MAVAALAVTAIGTGAAFLGQPVIAAISAFTIGKLVVAGTALGSAAFVTGVAQDVIDKLREEEGCEPPEDDKDCDEPDPGPTKSKDPFILDLDGDGVELTKMGNPAVFFDSDGDGVAESSGWVYGACA